MISFIGNASIQSQPAFEKLYKIEAGGDLVITEEGIINNIKTYTETIDVDFIKATIIDNIGNLTDSTDLNITVISDFNKVYTFDSTLNINFSVDFLDDDQYQVEFE